MTRSVCPYCGVGCGVVVDVRRGRVAGVRGDVEHPTNRGGLCAKGQRLVETTRTGDRLLHPQVRERAGEPFRRAGWEEAVARVAGGLRRTLAEHGPNSVALYLSGQLLTEDYYVANKLGKGLLGTANVDTNSRLCMASTVAAYKRAFGADGPPGCYEDLEAARDVLIIGSNAAETHPILFGRLRAARTERGAHWTVVDPRRTATAAAADEHLAIRPGCDLALLGGVVRALFDEDLVDEAAVRLRCDGLGAVRKAAAEMPVERAASICGVEAERIRALARRFARSPAALSLWCQGLNQSSSGTDKVNAVIDLHLLTGQIGRPGAGPFSLTGQSNAMGGRDVGAMATELAAHRAWGDAGVERRWGLGPLPRRRGLTAVELVDAIAGGSVRALWVASTNPLASLPDGAAARAAFAQLDLLVVQELYHPTDTTTAAHVLLPAAGWSEKAGTMTSSERRVALLERAVPPPGEARPDWAIFAAVGAALGAPRAFAWPDAAAVFAEHVSLTAGRDLDMTGLSHELLAREGPQQWPYPAGGAATARRYTSGAYATPDGRARLVSVRHREPAEAPTDEFPLRLLTGRDRDRWHTLTRTGKVASLRGSSDQPVLVLHPSDARTAGVEEGAPALVRSPRGAARAVVATDAGLPPGTAFLPFHGGPLLQPEGWANQLPGRALDPISFQPELKHTVVRVEPAPLAVALAGGALARAVAAALAREGVEVVRPSPGVRRVLVGGGEMGEARPWWDVVAEAPPAAGLAVLDLAAGPEPLAALPALQRAGWDVRWRGRSWLPAPVARRLAPHLPAFEPGPSLVVGAPEPGLVPEVPPGTLLLEPGGRLGQAGPLSADPVLLAGHLAGRLGTRATLRRLTLPVGDGSALVLAGDPTGSPSSDEEQGIDTLCYEDGDVAQVWRAAAGQVLGLAALAPLPVARELEALWLADPSPDALRRRFPVR